MTIRPPWAKLGKKWLRATIDYTVSPVHDVADDIEDGGATEPPSLEPLVTGITDEYPTSELIFDEDGDIVADG